VNRTEQPALDVSVILAPPWDRGSEVSSLLRTRTAVSSISVPYARDLRRRLETALHEQLRL